MLRSAATLVAAAALLVGVQTAAQAEEPDELKFAIILSAAVGHWSDFAIILVLLLANAIIGFWEEHQAGNAIAAQSCSE